MKKLIIALSLAATFVATKSEAQTSSPAKSTEKGTKELVILHTNDTHSCIYPLNPQLADTLKAGRGGFLRRIAMLKEERKRTPIYCYSIAVTFHKGRLTTLFSKEM